MKLATLILLVAAVAYLSSCDARPHRHGRSLLQSSAPTTGRYRFYFLNKLNNATLSGIADLAVLWNSLVTKYKFVDPAGIGATTVYPDEKIIDASYNFSNIYDYGGSIAFSNASAFTSFIKWATNQSEFATINNITDPKANAASSSWTGTANISHPAPYFRRVFVYNISSPSSLASAYATRVGLFEQYNAQHGPDAGVQFWNAGPDLSASNGVSSIPGHSLYNFAGLFDFATPDSWWQFNTWQATQPAYKTLLSNVTNRGAVNIYKLRA